MTCFAWSGNDPVSQSVIFALCTLAHAITPVLTCFLYSIDRRICYSICYVHTGWLSGRVVSVLDSGAEGPGFKSQPRHCWVTVLGKSVAVLLRVARVTAGLAESNDSLPPGLWLMPSAGWLPRTGISFGSLRSAVEYELPLPFYLLWGPCFIVNDSPVGIILLALCIHWEGDLCVFGDVRGTWKSHAWLVRETLTDLRFFRGRWLSGPKRASIERVWAYGRMKFERLWVRTWA